MGSNGEAGWTYQMQILSDVLIAGAGGGAWCTCGLGAEGRLKLGRCSFHRRFLFPLQIRIME